MDWASEAILQPLVQGGLTARLAGPQDMARIYALRVQAFPRVDGKELPSDSFDPACHHVLVEAGDRLLAAYRVMIFAEGAALTASYAAQFYDLSTFANYPKPILEMGRFCLTEDPLSWQALRLSWGAMTRIVDTLGAGLMIGCSSFKGAEPKRHGAALALLRSRHMGPNSLMPLRKTDQAVDLPDSDFDHREALSGLPSVLRSYLTMGGWTSDHAVLDKELDTLHVFTCVSVADFPPERARLLRQIAQKPEVD